MYIIAHFTLKVNKNIFLLSISQNQRNDKGFYVSVILLYCCVQHIFGEDIVVGGGVVDQHVGHRADELAVLDNRRAGHECLSLGTTSIFAIPDT